MWTLRAEDVRTAGAGVQLLYSLTDHQAVQRRAAEMGADAVRRRVLEAAAGSQAVLRLVRLQAQYRDADAERQAAEGTASRLSAERGALVDSCGPGLAGRLVELDRQVAEARGGAGQGLAALEPLLEAAYKEALGEVRNRLWQESSRAAAEAGRARAEALAALAALPAEVQEHLTTLAAVALCSFAASGGALLGGSAEGLLALALRQAVAAAAEDTREPEPAEAEAPPGTAVATMG